MRWTLRYQILTPMCLAMLVTVTGLSGLNAYSAGQRTRANLQRKITDVASTLAESNFPLTSSVLRQMQGFSGAQFVVLDRSGAATGSTSPKIAHALQAGSTNVNLKPFDLAAPVEVGDAGYYLAVLDLGRRKGIHPGEDRLVVLYPAREYREAWFQAILPPVVIGAASLVLVSLIGIVVASRIVRPLDQLRLKLGRIAAGEFKPVPLPKYDDELRDLALDVNRMSDMLIDYEAQVRKTEQVRTMGQLARGIAHQLRNSATGAIMALDLHREQCPLNEMDESLEIVHRQLQLIAKYLQRFLTLNEDARQAFETLDLNQMLERLVNLLRPTADHLAVRLQVDLGRSPVLIHGSESLLEHALLNVLLNAIEAAERGNADVRPTVNVSLAIHDESEAVFTVRDTGDGPATEVADSILEPFVTTKESGTGLGLSIARDIVVAHQGALHWRRKEGETEFELRFALLHNREGNEETRVEAARS